MPLLLRAPVCRRNGNAKQTIPTEAHSYFTVTKIIDTLISNSEIKEILVSRMPNNIIPAENEIAYNRELLVPATKRYSY